MNIINLKNKYILKLFLVVYFILLCILFIRSLSVKEISDFMWAEDGGVFLYDAMYSSSISPFYAIISTFQPHSGYIAFTTRLFALITYCFNPEFYPIVLLLCCLAVYAFVNYIIIISLMSNNLNKYVIISIISIINIMPTDSEIWLNITNVQWHTGLAFIIYSLLYKGNKSFIFNLFVIVFLGLNGPYNITVFPIYLAKLIYERKIEDKNFFYLSCIIFVVNFFSIKSRMIDPYDELLPLTWSIFKDILLVYIQSFLFLFGSSYAKICALLILILTAFGVVDSIKNYKHNINLIKPLCLFLAAAAIILAAIVAYFGRKDAFLDAFLNNETYYSRYIYIPHALFIISIVFLVHRNILRYMIFACFFLISLIDFSFLKKEHINYYSFVNLSQYQNILVPINPLNNIFRNKSNFLLALLKPIKHLPEERIHSLIQDAVKFQDSAYYNSNNTVFRENEGEYQIFSPALEKGALVHLKLQNPISCPDSKDFVLVYTSKSSIPLIHEVLLMNVNDAEIMSKAIVFRNDEETRTTLAMPLSAEKAEVNMQFTVNPYSTEPLPKDLQIVIKDISYMCLPSK